MLRNIWQVAWRECRRLIADRRMLLILLGVPLLYATMLNIMYMNQVVSNIPTAIYDNSGSGLSRAAVKAFSDSEKFEITSTVNSEAEMRQVLESRQVQVVIVIPKDYAEDIKRGQGSKILVAANGTNFLYSNSVLSSAGEIVATISGAVTIGTLQGSGYLPDTAKKMAAPVESSTRIWYNPYFNYPNFLMLGLVATIVQQILMLLAAISITKEKEEGSLKELIDGHYTAAQVVIGKVAPYFLVNLIMINILLAECYYIFAIPFNGSLANLLLMEVLFLGGITVLSIFLSIVCKNQLEATQLAMLFALPSFLFSGYTWPLDSMPALARAAAAIFPLTYFAGNLRDMALMDIQLPVLMSDILVLAAINIVLLPVSILLFRRQYHKFREI